ncbi:hypothetical protein ACHAQJ_004075 [Trichoderma viride]
MRVRDETDRVAQKVQGAAKVRNFSATQTSPKFGTSSTSGDGSDGAVPLPSPLWVSWAEPPRSNAIILEPEIDPGFLVPRSMLTKYTNCALTYFMSSYIISTMFGGYLPSLYLEEPQAEDALSSAILAASFATFAQRVRDNRFINVSRKYYSIALSRTNATLADPSNATRDRTLAAVLALGLFESIIFHEKKSLRN